MNVKKTIKKIVALGAGATMVGATMMGALAQADDTSLADYPGNFMTDGQFDGKIVVGQDAKTEDVLGAIDIAASLQAASSTETQVDVPGAAGRTTLQGDAVEIGEAGDLLSINEPLGDVRETLTEFELGALKGGTISTDEGTTAYKQYLRFKTANTNRTNGIFPTAVIYGPNDAPSEQVSDWMHIAEGDDVTQDAFFEWEIEFEEGLEAEVEGDGTSGLPHELEDLEDEVFNIFGTDFVFVDSELSGTHAAPDLTLEFLAGDVTDSLQEGETKTYTIDGKDYEVTNVFVSNPNQGTVEAKLSVNGELTDAMEDGDTDILSDGLEVGIQEILVSERGGVIEFFLGAQKVQFQDTNTSDGTGDTDDGFEQNVEITEENIEDGFVRIAAQTIGGGSGNISTSDEFEVTSIKYRLTADAITGTTDIFVPEGHGVREFLDEPAGMLSPDFDIEYHGFIDVGETPIEISARGDDEYRVRATNRQGNTYSIPYVEVTDAGVLRFGEDTDESFIFVENNFSDIASPSSSDFFINQDDKVVIWNGRDDVWDDQAFSHVIEYQSIDRSQQVLTFEDLATGTKEFTYSSSSKANTIGQGDLIVGGNAYSVFVSADNASNNPVAMDLNADGTITQNKSKFAVKGGGIIDFGDSITTPNQSIDDTGATLVLHTEGSEFDETDEGDEELRILVNETSDDEVTLSFVNYTRTDVTAGDLSGVTLDRANQVFLEGIGNVSTTSGRFEGFAFDPQEPDDNDDHKLEMTDFGVSFDLFDPSGDEPEELTLGYPNTERGVQVFVTAGETTATKGGPGGVTTQQVNPIAVGLAVLDVNAPSVGSENLIAVGGPSVNRVSAELMGVDYQPGADTISQLGFEPGKATIKLYEDNNAILVAGHGAQDTLGASYVLADHADYNLQGDEVEVTVADLDTISVSPVGGSS